MVEEEIDLREYINVLVKKKKLIITIILISIIVAGIINYFVLEPVYQVSATLIFNQPRNKSALIDYYSLEQYADRIKSNEIEEEIISLFNLDKAPYDLSASVLDKNVSAEVLKNTNKIRVSYQFKESGLAQNIVNQWINMFVEKESQIYFEEVENQYNTIKEQYKIVKNEFNKIEEEKIQFDISSDINILKDTINNKRVRVNNNNLRLQGISITLAKQKADRDYKSRELENQEKTIKLIRRIDDNQYFQRMLSKLVEDDNKIDIVEMQYEIEEVNPIYYSLYQELLNIDSSIKMLKVEKEYLVAEIETIGTEIDELVSKLIDKKIIETNLQREYISIQSNYIELSEQYKEIELAYNTRANLLEVEKLATKPLSPVKPNKNLNLAISGALGIFLAIFIAFFMEFWHSGTNKKNT